MEDIKGRNDLDDLSVPFYQNMNIRADGARDVWQVECSTMVSYFRGAPHVHVWVDIRARPQSDSKYRFASG